MCNVHVHAVLAFLSSFFCFCCRASHATRCSVLGRRSSSRCDGKDFVISMADYLELKLSSHIVVVLHDSDYGNRAAITGRTEKTQRHAVARKFVHTSQNSPPGILINSVLQPRRDIRHHQLVLPASKTSTLWSESYLSSKLFLV